MKDARYCSSGYHIKTLLLISIFFAAAADAQPSVSCYAGVFLTERDFTHNELSHIINTAEEGYKLTFAFPADFTLTLKIITPDTIFKFPPGSIYGFSECGRVYRYFKGGIELDAQRDFYEIEQAGGLILYSSAFVSGNEIFYSTNLTSQIRRLRLMNVREDFGDHPEFIAEAKKLKRKADGLTTRDENGFIILELFEEKASLTTDK